MKQKWKWKRKKVKKEEKQKSKSEIKKVDSSKKLIIPKKSLLEYNEIKQSKHVFIR